MRTTRRFQDTASTQPKIAVTTEELQCLLSCGRDSAVQVGESAEARIQIGRRVLWNVEKIKEYVNFISY